MLGLRSGSRWGLRWGLRSLARAGAGVVVSCCLGGGVVVGAAASPIAQPAPSAPSVPSTPSASTTPSTPSIDSPGSFAFALLRRGALPATGSNVCAVLAWETAEGGQFVPGASQYNPLNTTKSMPGDSVFNSVGVRNYPDWNTGLEATWLTLESAFYDAIRAALQRGSDAIGVLSAVTASPWGTKFSDPAASLSGCAGWAGEFDRRRLEVQGQIDSAAATAVAEQGALNNARAKQGDLDSRYQQMAAQIGAARAHLGQFARELYISGIDPALASNIDAMTSGDPIEYQLVTSFPSYVGARQAQAVQRSLALLAEVAGDRDRAAQVVAGATARVQSAQDALAKAQQAMADLENSGASSIY